MTRRELFGSFSKEKKQIVLHPPYYKEDEDFSSCKDCEGFCQKACPYEIIILKNSIPTLNFSKNGCSYCDECAKSCKYDVLVLEQKKEISAKIEISVLKCLSWKNTLCFSCQDPCEYDAIEFLGMFKPKINDKCVSCGFCLSVCPQSAIEIKG